MDGKLVFSGIEQQAGILPNQVLVKYPTLVVCGVYITLKSLKINQRFISIAFENAVLYRCFLGEDHAYF
jgi:hypothetical protein